MTTMTCRGCRRALRPRKVPAAMAPGTIRARCEGWCDPCWDARRRRTSPGAVPHEAWTTGNRGWEERALCTQIDPEMFFPGKGEPATEARGVCRRCPVRAQCLARALAAPTALEGIWAGTSRTERQAMRRNMARAATAIVRDAGARRQGAEVERARAEQEAALTRLRPEPAAVTGARLAVVTAETTPRRAAS